MNIYDDNEKIKDLYPSVYDNNKAIELSRELRKSTYSFLDVYNIIIGNNN